MIRLTVDLNNRKICSLVLVNTTQGEIMDDKVLTLYKATLYNNDNEEVKSKTLLHDRAIASHELFAKALRSFAEEFQRDWEEHQQKQTKKNLELLTFLLQHANTKLDNTSSSSS